MEMIQYCDITSVIYIIIIMYIYIVYIEENTAGNG